MVAATGNRYCYHRCHYRQPGVDQRLIYPDFGGDPPQFLAESAAHLSKVTRRASYIVPSVNWLLWAGCIGIVLYFKESSHMEAAYGLAITLTMIMTTDPDVVYLHVKRVSKWVVVVFLVIYLAIEGSFLAANLLKFTHGGWVSLVLATVIGLVITVWLRAIILKCD
jgi:K+ transporter